MGWEILRRLELGQCSPELQSNKLIHRTRWLGLTSMCRGDICYIICMYKVNTGKSNNADTSMHSGRNPDFVVRAEVTSAKKTGAA